VREVMHPNSIYVLNIQNFLGFQKLKEDSSFLELGNDDFDQKLWTSVVSED
jgi:hypothetical protein